MEGTIGLTSPPIGRVHIGHVEKTNDRDYEIEERYVVPCRVSYYSDLSNTNIYGLDGTGQWRLLQIAYRKKQRDI